MGIRLRNIVVIIFTLFISSCASLKKTEMKEFALCNCLLLNYEADNALIKRNDVSLSEYMQTQKWSSEFVSALDSLVRVNTVSFYKNSGFSHTTALIENSNTIFIDCSEYINLYLLKNL